jgi:hypothetical protein
MYLITIKYYTKPYTICLQRNGTYFLNELRIKPRAQNRTCDAEDVFQSLNSHNQELTLDHSFGIREQNALEEAEKPEPWSDPDPEPDPEPDSEPDSDPEAKDIIVMV